MDQNAALPGKDGRVCVQGLVTFTDATPETGGLCVIPGSHKGFKELCQRAHSHRLPGDFVPVQAGDPVFELGGRLVCAKAGDLLLWDSRCVHCNTPGVGEPGTLGAGSDSKTDAAAAAELLRVVGYVCMTPAGWASRDILGKRKDAFIHHVGTNHCPHEHHPGDPGQVVFPPNNWSSASDAQKRLIVGPSAEDSVSQS